jgi:hypothetical protein
MSGKNRISAADLPARYQAQVAAELGARDDRAAVKRIFTAGTKPMAQVKKRLRQSTKPLMNKLETEFMDWLVRTGTPKENIFPQAMRLEISNGHWYKPDFFVTPTESDEWPQGWFYECKGPHSFRGGFENVKDAARRFKHFKFILVWLDDGRWQEQTVLP